MASVKRDAAASRKACDMERRREWGQKYADQEKVLHDGNGPKTTTFHDYDLEVLGVPYEALPLPMKHTVDVTATPCTSMKPYLGTISLLWLLWLMVPFKNLNLDTYVCKYWIIYYSSLFT